MAFHRDQFLGLLLFILYTAPIVDIIKKHDLLSHSYADDTQLYFYCSPDQSSNLAAKFSSCIADVKVWMSANRLKLNCEKTEVMWLTSKRRINVAPSCPVVIDNSSILPTAGARSLGIFVNSTLDLRQHINNVCRRCYFVIRQLKTIRRSLPKDALKQLLHAFLFTHLDYCNSLYYGLPDSDIQKLQRVQNAAVRLGCGLSRYDHVTPSMRDDLHWLPVRQRIEYKIAVITFKCLYDLAPTYLQTMCRLASDVRGLENNRSAARRLLIVPTCHTSSYGHRTFKYAASKIWNSLPDSLRFSNSLPTFKKNLKTYFFTKAYL